MNRSRVPTPLSGRISAFLPVVAAAVLGWTGLQAQADPGSDLQAQLNLFAAQEGVTKAVTPATAPAADLVYAIYLVSQNAPYAGDATQTGLLVQAAFNSSTKKRADIVATAPRVLNAAIQGANLDDAGINTVLQSATTPTQVSSAGRAATVAQALKSSSTIAAGTAIADTAFAASSTAAGKTADLRAEAFASAALKLVGGSTAIIPTFAEEYLIKVGTVSGATANSIAIKIAEGAAAVNPAAAGAVIGGQALRIQPDATLADALLRSVFADTKLTKAEANSVGSVALAYGGGNQQQLGLDLFDATKSANGPTVKGTTPHKAAVVAGLVQSLGSSAILSDVAGLITTFQSAGGTTLATKDYATFAGGAAVGTADSAGLVAAAVSNLEAATDVKNRTAIGTAVIKAIATTSPSSAYVVAQDLITAANQASQAFNGNTAVTTLAKALAKAAPTNTVATGAAVAGAASELSNASDVSSLALFANAVFSSAPKATASIVTEIVEHVPTGSGITGLSFVNAIKGSVAAAYVANAAAGAAVADDADAASIAAAASTGSETSKPKTIAIATAVATGASVERVAEVAQSIGNLLQPTKAFGSGTTATIDKKLPKVSSASALAKALAKAIQTKPLVQTENRQDELGELAATLVDAAVTKIAPGVAKGATTAEQATAKAWEPTIAAIGKAILAQLSTKKLQNSANLAADKLDEVGDVAGSIFQAITYNTAIPDAVKTALLVGVNGKPSPLQAALRAGATAAYKGQVDTALAEVLGAFNSVTNPGNVVIGSETIATGVTGKYEVGNFYDPESGAVNL